MPDEEIDVALNNDVDRSANSSREKKKKKPDKKKNGKKSPLGLLLLAVILAATVWIFGFNGMGLRDNTIFPALRNVPVLKNYIPPEKEDEDGEEDEYKDKDRNDVIEENKKLKSQIEKLEEEKDNLRVAVEDGKKEITRLKIFETEQAKFREEKKVFDTVVASGDTPEFREYYESVYPENADEIYKSIIQNEAMDKEVKNYINTFENMKKDAAAKILENLTGSDMDLVVEILRNLSDNQRSDILSAMDDEIAASCVKQLAPMEINLQKLF